MTVHGKDAARVLVRAESLRIAIVESGLPRDWEPADLENMADAATMLWDQANDVSTRQPASKLELAEAISRIFEPLLMWAGRFDLCSSLAGQRASSPAFKASPWDAKLVKFEALAFKGRYQDDQALIRESTFGRAQNAFADLINSSPVLSTGEVARMAHAWFVIGLEGAALQTLLSCHDRAEAYKYYQIHPAPAHWRASYIGPNWLELLRDFPTRSNH